MITRKDFSKMKSNWNAYKLYAPGYVFPVNKSFEALSENDHAVLLKAIDAKEIDDFYNKI